MSRADSDGDEEAGSLSELGILKRDRTVGDAIKKTMRRLRWKVENHKAGVFR